MKTSLFKSSKIKPRFVLTLLLSYLVISGDAAKACPSHKFVIKHELQLTGLIERGPDTALILKKCLNLPELQQYFTKNPDGTDKQVYIMQYAVKFPVNTAVSKFNKNILFKSRQEIYSNNAETFLIFRTFSIEGENATVVFDFNYNYKTTPGMVEVSLSLHKTGTEWNVTANQIRRLL
jgi:hypothetical protein